MENYRKKSKGCLVLTFLGRPSWSFGFIGTGKQTIPLRILSSIGSLSVGFLDGGLGRYPNTSIHILCYILSFYFGLNFIFKVFGKLYKFNIKDNKMKKIGGQAVFNGVMMYNRPDMAVAIRKDKKIKVKKFKINLFPKIIQKLFFIRGIFNLIEMLYIGIKSLKWSTDEAVEEDVRPSSIWFVVTFLISIIVAILIFKFIPLLIATGFSRYNDSNFLFNLVDGIIKFSIFLGYIYVISLMDDIKEIFKYHGAEHKTVNCYEDNKDLTIENVQSHKTLNPRCGTSFILIVILISIIVYMFIPREFSFLEKFGYRLLLLPIIAGISYEVLRLGNKLKFISYFGMVIQKITTKEPRDDQVEVAIKSLKEVL